MISITALAESIIELVDESVGNNMEKAAALEIAAKLHHVRWMSEINSPSASQSLVDGSHEHEPTQSEKSHD